MIKNKVSARSYVFFAVSSLIAIAYLFYIYIFGINCPLFDQFEYLRLIQKYYQHEISFSEILLDGHNEHLMGISNLIMATLDWADGFNFKLTMIISGVIQILSTLLVLAIFRDSAFKPNKISWHIPVVFLIMLSPSPAQNIFFSFNVAWFLVTFFGLISIYSINLVQWGTSSSNKDYILILIAVLFCFFASLSSAPGMFFIFSSFIVVIYKNKFTCFNQLANNKKFLVTFSAYLFLIILLIVIYKYSSATKVTSDDIHILSILKTWVLVLSTISGLSSPKYAFIIGAGVFLLVFMSLFQIKKTRCADNFAAPLAMIVFGILFSLSVAIGRSNLAPSAGLEDRYAAYVLVMMCGVFFVAFNDVIQGRAKYILKFLFILIFGVSTVTGLKHAIEYGIYVREERSIASMILADPSKYSDFQIYKLLYQDTKIVRDTSHFFESHALWKFNSLQKPLPERHAIPYFQMPEELLREKVKYPNKSLAIDNLWQVYVACADLRDVFPVKSPNFYKSLLKWTVNEFSDGEHHAHSQLETYKEDYIFLLQHVDVDG